MAVAKETRVTRILTIVALLLPIVGVHAQQAATAPDEAPPRYQIELLAFERPGEQTEEQWPMDPGLPDPSLAAGRLSEPLSGPVTLLPPEQASLQAAAYALRTNQMPPLLHLVWQQPVESREQAKGWWLEEERIGGLIKVSLGRYLHLDLDLLLTDPETGAVYRIIDHRRMRSEQLNHLDHPKLGILVQITPLPQENSEPEAPVSGETVPSGETANLTPEPAQTTGVGTRVPE